MASFLRCIFYTYIIIQAENKHNTSVYGFWMGCERLINEQKTHYVCRLGALLEGGAKIRFVGGDGLVAVAKIPKKQKTALH